MAQVDQDPPGPNSGKLAIRMPVADPLVKKNYKSNEMKIWQVE